jgi:hypothetical protein
MSSSRTMRRARLSEGAFRSTLNLAVRPTGLTFRAGAFGFAATALGAVACFGAASFLVTTRRGRFAGPALRATAFRFAGVLRAATFRFAGFALRGAGFFFAGFFAGFFAAFFEAFFEALRAAFFGAGFFAFFAARAGLRLAMCGLRFRGTITSSLP